MLRSLLLVCLLLLSCFPPFSQSKQDLRKIKSKARTIPKPVTSAKVIDGLPGEVEYEVDLTDQERDNPVKRSGSGHSVKAEQQEEEEEGDSLFSRLLESVREGRMAEDIADKLDDLICAWDKVVGSDFETLVLLLLGWLAFGGVIFLLSHLIYSSLGSGEETVQVSAPPTIPPFKGADPAQPSLPNIYINNNTKSAEAVAGGVAEASGVPKAVGSDTEVVEYVNKCWSYLYSTPQVIDQMKRLWLEKMNEFTKRSALDHANELVVGMTQCTEVEEGVYQANLNNTLIDTDGLYVEFQETPGDTLKLCSKFENVTAEPLPADNMSVTGEVGCSFNLNVKTTRPIRDNIETASYTLTVDKLRARFSLTVIKGERLIIGKLEGWPDLKIRVLPAAGPTPNLTKEDENLADLVEEIATSALRGVQLDVRTDELAGFPVFTRTVFQTKPNQLNGKLSNSLAKGGTKPFSLASRTNGQSDDGPVRLLDVKVVKAVQLGGQAGNCLEPYVVIEVDDPSQRKQTGPGTGPHTQWNETFTIEISRSSSEILFEVWDQAQKIGKSDIFQGLGIVSVSELMVTASQRHVIPLQGRPYEDDQVTGMLTIEFLFKDGGVTFSEADNLYGVHRTLEMRQSKGPSGSLQYNKKTTYSLYDPPDGADQISCYDKLEKRSPSLLHRDSSVVGDSFTLAVVKRESLLRQDLLNGADVADVALKELEIGKGKAGQQPTKSTLLIHQVQKPPTTPSSTSCMESTEEATDSIGGDSINSTNTGPFRRGRDKRRSLMSSIKKRFSARSLSTSIKLQDGGSRNSSGSRGASLDRVRSASEHRPDNLSNTSSDTDSGCSLSLPSWRGSVTLSWESDSYLRIPGMYSEDASSMSDVSGISNASNKTYVTEESSLVLETLEDGRHHHYLIPSQVAKRGRFKKKGIKLHIYLDHIFVARHIKLGTVCAACDMSIPMRLGKQAYVCRDCGITVHKPCHVKVDNHCLQTSLPSMELEYYNEGGAV